ncbi:helix-turn-helix domain-containing protein [Thermodesulfovibrio sp. Kuro-1]|uniref:helix-turn-helix domain-containing protein n=1 Tax=Thermodesulfovibrio sp. Kuro-1 TaxID=2580394 RepID=UPI0015E86FC0|nr:helix-turn-helix domain-containing protein [Thermodesulfovibrio sp. Kuro-1]
MKKYYLISEEELKRYEVLTQALRGCITLRQASEILGLSYRQCLRLKERFQNKGFEGLFRKSTLFCYNRLYVHSALGYLSPEEYELKYYREQQRNVA